MIKDTLLVLMVFIFHFFLLILSSPEKKPFQALLCAKLQLCDLFKTTLQVTRDYRASESYLDQEAVVFHGQSLNPGTFQARCAVVLYHT